MDDVIKLEFMVKRSQMKGRILTHENYKSRWFKLTSQFLFYCDGKLETGCGRVKGQIALSSIIIIEHAESESLGNRPFAFQVVYRTADEYDETCTLYIMALRESCRTEWIEALRKASLNCGAQFASKFHPGVWLTKQAKYKCCDSVNKRTTGCISVTVALDECSRESSFPLNGCSPKANDVNKEPTRRQKKSSGPVRNPNATYVVALYEYTAHSKDNLDLVKGEEYELLDDFESSSWLRVKNAKGATGRVPANYIQLVGTDNVEQYDWFYRNMSRTQSEIILEKDGREGCFMVRDSSQPGVYTLTIMVATADKGVMPKHYHIKQLADGQYYLSDRHHFTTIPELIYYHKLNSGGLITRLRFPPSDRVKPTLSIDADEIDPGDLELKKALGAGQFGEVRLAIYRREIEVAVKTMKEDAMSEDDFIDEAKIMVTFRHNNLVKLFGVCTKSKPLMIVTEYMKNGALVSFLKRQKHFLRSRPAQLVDMCVQVCSAMDYLEQNKFIHRDLAARNCLVGENNVVKVADFGMARFVVDDEYNSSFGSKYPVKWASPEVLGYTKFSSKSDVWAFGVLMWEIFSCGDMPYSGQKNPDVVHMVCQQRKHLPKPEDCPEGMFRFMVQCWNYEPESRPSFSTLHGNLRDLMERDYVQ